MNPLSLDNIRIIHRNDYKVFDDSKSTSHGN